MNPEPSTLAARLLQLLHASREERDAQARTALNELLLRDAAARALMARLLVDEQALVSQLRDESIVAILDEHSPAMPSLPVRSSQRPARWWPVPLATAAAFLITSLGFWLWQPAVIPVVENKVAAAPAPANVAVVTQTVEAKWKGAAFKADDRVPVGRLALTSGLVRLQFLCGATVIIEGPAELELTSERGAEVHSGLVTAIVPPVAEGFTLVAAGWRAVDRGTVFGIDARSPDRTEVHVIEGKVDLHHGSDASVRSTLTTGQAARLTAQTLVEQPAASARFPRESEVIDRAASADRRQLEAWQTHSEVLAADPSLVLYLDFESADHDRGIIRNRASGADPRTDGTLIGGEWTQGRWPGKQAVALQRVGDLIRTQLRSELNAATFMMSVRFEPTAPAEQTLLLSPDVRPGQVYWLLSRRAPNVPNHGLVFIKTPAQGANLRLAAGRGLTPQEREQWVNLAVVHDPATQRVRHYLNGELVKELPLLDATPLRLRELVIGNWGYTREPRNLVGRIDELAVFNRALNAAEVRSLVHSP